MAITDHGGLVGLALRRGGVTPSERDDAEQECWLAALRADGQHDPARGKESTYLMSCFFNAIRRHRSREHRFRCQRFLRRGRVTTTLFSELGGDFVRGQARFFGRDDPDPDDRIDAQRLSHHLARLHPRLRRVLELRFGLTGPPLTLQEVGDALGVTRERVRHLEVQAFIKLRRSLRPACGR